MTSEGDTQSRESVDAPARVYRVRRSEVIGALTFPALVALLGLLWSYVHGSQQSVEAKIERLRADIVSLVRDTKGDLQRELDRCCGGKP